MDANKNSDYFLNTRDYHIDLAKESKKFYKDFAKFLSNNLDQVEELRKLLDSKYISARSAFEFWSGVYILRILLMLRIEYILLIV
jgi:hypothetical protein